MDCEQQTMDVFAFDDLVTTSQMLGFNLLKRIRLRVAASCFEALINECLSVNNVVPTFALDIGANQ